jgi:hypothetical protein
MGAAHGMGAGRDFNMGGGGQAFGAPAGGQAGKPSAPGGQTMPMQGQFGQMGNLFGSHMPMSMQNQMQHPGVGQLGGQALGSQMLGTQMLQPMQQAALQNNLTQRNQPYPNFGAIPSAGLASLMPQAQQTGLAHYGSQTMPSVTGGI